MVKSESFSNIVADNSVQNTTIGFHKVEKTALAPQPVAVSQTMEAQLDQVNEMNKRMGDSPACPTCGHITIRSGACYKCLNCGTQTGCS
jgi:tRNA(Ile2) C34 agmatinyltransferase TiaS